MKNLIHKIPAKVWILGLFSAVCLLLAGGILIYENQVVKELYDQQMAGRWDKGGSSSQISLFFAEDAVEDAAYFKGIEQNVDKALLMASIVSGNENARLWIDAVSRNGKVSLSTNRSKIEVNVVGVSGEFFQFHPQKIVSGAIFSESNLMKDGIILDEDTAWQLFGSSDVAGMQVMIGEVPHFVTGVVEREQGRLQKAAGLEKPICFLSLESLEEYGVPKGGFTYEIVLPNPIQNFALSTMQNIVGTNNENVVVIENSTRFELLRLIGVIRDFGIRSMSLKGVVYPYWENVARGLEDILALCLLLKSMLLLFPIVFAMIVLAYVWRNRTWTLGKGIVWMQDKMYEAGTKRVHKKKKIIKKKRKRREN